MTVTGHPDWLPAVAIVDQPALIIEEFAAAIPSTGAVLDVRRWQSFQGSIWYNAPNAGPPGNTFIFRLRWADTAAFNNILHKQDYEINAVANTDCGQAVISDGMYGPFMQYNTVAGNGAADTVDLHFIGSNRPFTKTRASELSNVTTRGMSTDRHILIFDGNLGVGGTVYRNARLGVGPATISVSVAGPGGPVELFLHSPALGLTGGRSYQILSAAAPSDRHDRITLPRRCQALRMRNLSGASDVTVRATITMDDN